MDYFTLLPAELLDEIAYDELAYRGLLSLPVFARSLTIGRRFDFMIKFGYDCQIRPEEYNDEYDYYKYWQIEWTRNNILHRLDGPTIDCENGHTEWRVNGQLHCENGPAIKYENGDRLWYWKGKIHRMEGPAYQSYDYNSWYINGKLHRLDGPAIEYANGHKRWYINGKELYR